MCGSHTPECTMKMWASTRVASPLQSRHVEGWSWGLGAGGCRSEIGVHGECVHVNVCARAGGVGEGGGGSRKLLSAGLDEGTARDMGWGAHSFRLRVVDLGLGLRLRAVRGRGGCLKWNLVFGSHTPECTMKMWASTRVASPPIATCRGLELGVGGWGL